MSEKNKKENKKNNKNNNIIGTEKNLQFFYLLKTKEENE